MKKHRVIGLACLAMMLAAGGSPQASAVVAWTPALDDTFQIQFSGSLDESVDALVFDVDGADTPAASVTSLQSGGHRVVCYVNAGEWERWRADKKDFPASTKGKPLDGWPGERWLDVRNTAIRAPLQARMDVCKNKGFNGIEFDNVDGYQNDTGFHITKAKQQMFNEWLAAEAVSRGLVPGLKNDLGQIGDLVDDFGFAINEQCVVYKECELLQPFIDAGKPVFHIEYDGTLSKICSKSPSDFATIKKHLELDAFRKACP